MQLSILVDAPCKELLNFLLLHFQMNFKTRIIVFVYFLIYRQAFFTQCSRNSCKKKWRDLLSIFMLILGAYDVVLQQNILPAEFSLEVNGFINYM